MPDIDHDPGLRAKALAEAKIIMVLGMKSDPQSPPYVLSKVLQDAGYRIIGINPKVTELPGFEMGSSLDDPKIADIKPDILNIYRRSEFIPSHVDEILAMKNKPGLVWLQTGIRHDKAAKKLREAGINVVQDKCIATEYKIYVEPKKSHV